MDRDSFIQSLRAEMLESAAIHHPYLNALCCGDFPDYPAALRDFAFQYGFYSAKFTTFVCAVIDQLEQRTHKQVLLANLAEEQGNVLDVELPPAVMATVDNEPHANLYKRFQRACGVQVDVANGQAPCEAVRFWVQKFQSLCSMNQLVGVGAIGFGTELIVSHIYSQILDGLKQHSDLSHVDRVFFDLHSQCDDHHADQLLLIASELAPDVDTQAQIARGARMAVDLRVAFWDVMLERAYSVGGQVQVANHAH